MDLLCSALPESSLPSAPSLVLLQDFMTTTRLKNTFSHDSLLLSFLLYLQSQNTPFYYLLQLPNFKMPVDLLHPDAEVEARTHKLKRLVQCPNSFFMDIKCPGCFQITTVFSHAQTVVMCANCNIMLCQPTGGKARLTEGCSYRKKVD